MVTRIGILAALLLTASAARGTQFNWTPEVLPVPAIPHGLDWSIQLAPDPQPAVAKLSDDEVAQILPHFLKLDYADGEYNIAKSSSFSNQSPFGPVTAILIGSIFLLAAYDLIPRFHSQVLRYRSVDLRENLLS